MNNVVKTLEETVSPWAKILTPILLALIMFILNSMDKNQEITNKEMSNFRGQLAIIGERQAATETAIRIYHGNSGRDNSGN